ncbi:MAG: hypothetical protein EBS90_10175 [Betaproteobacteria bacterium]|nr:hypothetical protein [Betaproteobacteria bacterium]
MATKHLRRGLKALTRRALGASEGRIAENRETHAWFKDAKPAQKRRFRQILDEACHTKHEEAMYLAACGITESGKPELTVTLYEGPRDLPNGVISYICERIKVHYSKFSVGIAINMGDGRIKISLTW